MLIHQIWIGDGISGQDALDVDDIKQKCEAAGHTHKLWSYDELIDTLPPGQLSDAFDVAKGVLPNTMFASMVTDYFRLHLLSIPGIYLDTDVVCTVDKFPEFPGEFDIQMCTNSNGVSPNTCILHASNAVGAEGCAKGAAMVAHKLETEFLAGGEKYVTELANRLKAKSFSLVSFVGPAFFNRHVVPILSGSGVKTGFFDIPFASSANPSSVLYHRGKGSWCYGGNGNTNKTRNNANKSVADVWGGLPKDAYNI